MCTGGPGEAGPGQGLLLGHQPPALHGEAGGPGAGGLTLTQGGFEKKKKSFLIGPEWSGASLEQLRQSLVCKLQPATRSFTHPSWFQEREQQARQLQKLLLELQLKQQQQMERQQQKDREQQQQQQQQQLLLQLQLQEQQQQLGCLKPASEDWATSTETDLSRYTGGGEESDAVLLHDDSFDSFSQLGPDFGGGSPWPPVKTEVQEVGGSIINNGSSSILLDPPTNTMNQPSMYRCVNPMEVLGTVLPSSSTKLPSLWSPWPRPSSPTSARDDLREVPEPMGSLGEEQDLDHIDYDKLL